MNPTTDAKKMLLIGLAVFITLTCIFLIFIAIIFLVTANLSPGKFSDALGLLSIYGFGGGLAALAVGGLAWKFKHKFRSRSDGRKLAETMEATPPQSSHKKTTNPFPAGSIGGVSARIGYDVRDLYMAGFDRLDIADVEAGRITIDELWKRGPRK